MPTNASDTSKVWLVTGCSSGLGLLLVQAALAHGDKVVATARDITSLDAVATNDNCRTLALDVTASQADLDRKMIEAIALFGRVDVLVNNAGYVLSGVWEHVGQVTQKASISYSHDQIADLA